MTRPGWTYRRPATTITTLPYAYGPHAGARGESQSHNAHRITIEEALALQGFPTRYPLRGSATHRFRQVGNAMPPPLALAVLRAVLLEPPTMPSTIVEPFAGPGGWDHALATTWPDLHARTIGYELDRWACATRAAAGHHTIRADVADVDLAPLMRHDIEGLIGSPPCPTFSMAGDGSGRELLGQLVEAAHRGHMLYTDDPRTGLVLEPLRWARWLRPRWIALEQVPPVLPIWEATGHHLERLGYRWWTGILNAADYGVPQTRRRAILIASLDLQPHRPAPTHQRANFDDEGQRLDGGLFALEPWVTMAEALGWGDPETTLAAPHHGRAFDRSIPCTMDEPAPTMTFGHAAASWAWTPPAGAVVSTGRNTMRTSRDPEDMEVYERSIDEPAPTLDGKVSRWQVGEPGHRRPPMRWKVNTGRDWPAEGGRDGAQTIDPHRVPAPTVTGKAEGQWQRVGNGDGGDDPTWPAHRPATTVASRDTVVDPGATANRFNESTKTRNDGYRITEAEALVLQGFPPTYPVQGNKTARFQQIGDAMPPGLARPVLAIATGRTP